MLKEPIYIHDITFHIREGKQTISFSKVAEKGRMYSPLPQNYQNVTNTEGNKRKIPIVLPPDLQDRLNNGEIEIMIPADGLYMYAGKDVNEKIKSMAAKERRELIHRNRSNTLHNG